MNQPTNTLRIAFIGGGTGGHIYPLIAVHEALKDQCAQRNIAYSAVYLGSAGKFQKYVRDAGIEARTVQKSKWRAYWSLKNVFDVFLFGIGCLEALFHLSVIRPHIIFSKGGPGTLPIILASRLFRIPLIIHESDAIPGTSNRIAARFASRIELAFQEAGTYFKNKNINISGLPIRKQFLAPREEQRKAKQKLGFDPERPLLLVICGSQGARPINFFIQTHLPALLSSFQILHQVGDKNYKNFEKNNTRSTGYHAVPYLEDNIVPALDAADMILARAGATTLFEIAARGAAAILVPLEGAAHNHQMKNALAYCTNHPAALIEEKKLEIDVFLKSVENIRTGAVTRGKGSIPKNAAETIAHDILALAPNE